MRDRLEALANDFPETFRSIPVAARDLLERYTA